MSRSTRKFEPSTLSGPHGRGPVASCSAPLARFRALALYTVRRMGDRLTPVISLFVQDTARVLTKE